MSAHRFPGITICNLLLPLFAVIHFMRIVMERKNWHGLFISASKDRLRVPSYLEDRVVIQKQLVCFVFHIVSNDFGDLIPGEIGGHLLFLSGCEIQRYLAHGAEACHDSTRGSFAWRCAGAAAMRPLLWITDAK